MEIHDYIEQKKDIQNSILAFINSEEDIEEVCANLLHLFNEQQISENKQELKIILTLLNKIASNHFHCPKFYNKIERIILHFKDSIQTYFLNTEIFLIFHTNKQILLFIIKENIITIDDSIIDFMEKDENQFFYYFEFFYFEVENFLDDEFKNEIKGRVKELANNDLDGYNAKRNVGENDNYICQLIRNDNIDEFISHVNQNCIHLTSIIEPSIYETNLLLLKHEITLFEYSAFYGSLQIFKYLYLNGNNFSMHIWPFIIHGQHPEMINIFETDYIKKNTNDLDEFLIDLFRFHHNEMTNYIFKEFEDEVDLNDIQFYSQSLKYYNFAFFPTDFDDKAMFYYLCKYDYFTIVKILLNTKQVEINQMYV